MASLKPAFLLVLLACHAPVAATPPADPVPPAPAEAGPRVSSSLAPPEPPCPPRSTWSDVIGTPRGSDHVEEVRFAKAGSLVATAGWGSRVNIFDTRCAYTGAPKQAPATLVASLQHKAGVLRVAVSPDGSRVVSAGWDGMRIWDVATRTQLLEDAGGAASLAFSDDGKLFAAARRKLEVWDARTLRVVRTFDTPRELWRIAFAPDGAALLGSTQGYRFPRDLWEWDLTAVDPRPPRRILHDDRLDGVPAYHGDIAFLDGGHLVALGLRDEVVVFERASSRLVSHFDPYPGCPAEWGGCWVTGVAASPDGALLAVTTGEGAQARPMFGSATVWDWRRASRLAHLFPSFDIDRGLGADMRAIDWNGDGVIVFGGDGLSFVDWQQRRARSSEFPELFP